MKRNWFPTYDDMSYEANDSWLHSVWVGMVMGPFNWPAIFVAFILAPCWQAIKHIFDGLLYACVATFGALVLFPLAGLFGHMNARARSTSPERVE